MYNKIGSGPPLLFLPGMDGTGRLFFRQEPELAKRYTVLTFASRTNVPFHYDDLIKDVLQILASEKAEKATIVGESFGGTVALQFAARHQDRIEHLVLVNTFSYFPNRIRLRLGIQLLPVGYSKIGNAVRKSIMARVLRSELVDDPAIEKLLECSFSHGLKASRQRMKLIAEHNVRDQLAAIQVPVTIIASGKDKIVPSVREAQAMAKMLPNSRVVILPNYGHSCLLTEFSLAAVLGSPA